MGSYGGSWNIPNHLRLWQVVSSPKKCLLGPEAKVGRMGPWSDAAWHSLPLCFQRSEAKAQEQLERGALILALIAHSLEKWWVWKCIPKAESCHILQHAYRVQMCTFKLLRLTTHDLAHCQARAPVIRPWTNITAEVTQIRPNSVSRHVWKNGFALKDNFFRRIFVSRLISCCLAWILYIYM